MDPAAVDRAGIDHAGIDHPGIDRAGIDHAAGHGPTRSGWSRCRHLVRRVAPVAILMVVAVTALAIRRQAPWVPWPYLLLVTGIGTAIWALLRWRPGPTWARATGLVVASATLLALLPVPWMTAALDEPPGTAWRLDGRLHVDGERIDPPGEWYWLTVGRPPLVIEVARGWLGGPAPSTLRSGTAASRPQMNEPAAVAVGLHAAGRPMEFDLVVELSDPILDALPERLVIAALNGIAPTDRQRWRQALDSLGHGNTIEGPDGAVHVFDGTTLPYRRADLLDVPATRLDAVIGGRLARTPIGRWFRGLALGRSHGMMVALVTYAHASGHDLARGRSIAGTGGIGGDGTVTRVGGLRSKATAAIALGVDVLLVPAEQLDELEGLDRGSTEVITVDHLDDAIAALTADRLDQAVRDDLGDSRS